MADYPVLGTFLLSHFFPCLIQPASLPHGLQTLRLCPKFAFQKRPLTLLHSDTQDFLSSKGSWRGARTPRMLNGKHQDALPSCHSNIIASRKVQRQRQEFPRLSSLTVSVEERARDAFSKHFLGTYYVSSDNCLFAGSVKHES